MQEVKIYGPGITYQYSDDGEIDRSHNGGFDIVLDPYAIADDASNVPDLWQARFKAQWPRYSPLAPDAALRRLRELVQGELNKLPENPFVLHDAWLVGIPIRETKDMMGKGPSAVARHAARLREEIDEWRKREAHKQAHRDLVLSRVSLGMQPEGLLTNYNNGDKAKPIGRAWWLDGALDCGNGRIEVARIRAKSVTMRYPAKHELLPGVLAPNRYESSPNYTGDWVTYMLGLTEEELRAHGICPGIYQCPGIVDGSRPASNRSDRPISMRQHQQDMAWLQNDCVGCPEDY